MYYVYVLRDPRNYNVRYVGYTKNLNSRLIEHCSRSRNAIRPTHKQNWIRELLRLELEPLINFIWAGESKQIAFALEEYYIWYYSQSYKLTNLTEKKSARKYTKEDRDHYRKIFKPIVLTEEARLRKNKKISEKAKGNKRALGVKRTKEQINAMKHRLLEYYKTHDSTMKGKKHTELAKLKMSIAKKGQQSWLGKHHTEETKNKIRAKNKNYRHTKEQYEKMEANRPRGEECSRAYLDKEIVKYIRIMKLRNARPSSILRTFKKGTISQSAFEHIWYNRSWKHIQVKGVE